MNTQYRHRSARYEVREIKMVDLMSNFIYLEFMHY